MTIISKGQRAPDFDLPADSGETFRLSAWLGRPVVLVFYNQDDTDNCTTEMMEFSRLAPDFAQLGAVLVGISPDDVDSHRRFRDKHRLTTLLLADPDHRAIGPYGVWGPKLLYGRAYEGLIRSTIVVGADGRVADSFKVSRIRGHAQKVLDAVRGLGPAA